MKIIMTRITNNDDAIVDNEIAKTMAMAIDNLNVVYDYDYDAAAAAAPVTSPVTPAAAVVSFPVLPIRLRLS